MKMDMPKETNDGPVTNHKRVINLVLGANDKIYWYKGLPEADQKINLTHFSNEGIRRLLIEQNARIKGMVVLIKPSDKSKYKNVIDILDEMAITRIAHYSMVDVTQQEEELIEKSNL